MNRKVEKKYSGKEILPAEKKRFNIFVLCIFSIMMFFLYKLFL